MEQLKKVIPVFRKIINEVGIEYKNIINSNSFYLSDSSIIADNGLSLDGRTREDNLVVMNLLVEKVLFNEEENVVYNAKLEIDIYGEKAHSIGLEIYRRFLSRDMILRFIENKIGIDPNILLNNAYETLHGVQWLRTRIELLFNYEYKSSYIDQEYIDKYNIEIEKGEENE